MPSATNKKIFVGLSGGVDSAVSAALLKEQGYDVTGVFMKNWSNEEQDLGAECPWKKDQSMAEAVCKELGISFRSFNFEKEYRARVLEYFFSDYKAGRTPNPDVMCNKEIKFGLFLEKALREGADYIATGHYVRRAENMRSGESTVYQLLKGVDPNKDQSYFLYNITQEQLSRSLFPIGHLTKPEVRKLAFKMRLPNAGRPDSQGICFIGDIDVQDFLRTRIPEEKGKIVDVDTEKVVGEHDGVWFYTIGQREGLGIGGQEVPYFVVGKDAEKNVLYVGHGHEHKKLLGKEVVLENLYFIDPVFAKEREEIVLSGVARYRQRPQAGMLNVSAKTFTFDTPQRAITSGQSLVLYDDEVCVGGGVIR